MIWCVVLGKGFLFALDGWRISCMGFRGLGGLAMSFLIPPRTRYILGLCASWHCVWKILHFAAYRITSGDWDGVCSWWVFARFWCFGGPFFVVGFPSFFGSFRKGLSHLMQHGVWASFLGIG